MLGDDRGDSCDIGGTPWLEIVMEIRDIVSRLAHHIWDEFNENDIENNTESNWRAAEGIINDVISGKYKLGEFKSMLQPEDVRVLEEEIAKRLRDNGG